VLREAKNKQVCPVCGCVTAEAHSRGPVAAEARVECKESPCEVSVEHVKRDA
jgi:hypothetical protein